MTIPANIEAEQAVLGAVLLSDEKIIPALLAQGLRPEDFSWEQHRLIFAAMVRMYEDRRHVDVVTLSEFLSSHDCLGRAGGRAGVDLLNSGVPAVGHYPEYARIVIDCAFLRRLRKVAQELQVATGERNTEKCRVLVGQAVSLLPKEGLRVVGEAA